MHIAIIGAGICGLLTALELVEQGCRITLFDQQEAGRASSWAGGGILSPMYPWRYPTAVNQLAMHGKALYAQWNEKLYPLTGIDFEIHETGMLIFDETDFATGLKYADHYQQPMQQSRLLCSTELEQVNPRLAPQLKQALYFPYLANIRNPRLLQSLITFLKQHPKVEFFEHCPIEQLIYQGDRITAIKTHHGKTLHADHVVLCSGAWSKLWSSSLNLEIPVEPVQGQMLLFKTPPNWLPTMCMNQVMYLIPRKDGHIVCGSSVLHRGFDTQIDSRTQQRILDACLNMIPELKQFPIVQRWAGLRPSSPDGIPFIGLMPEYRNLWANFGHYRNGLCMGAASARLLRQLMLDQPLMLDPTPYSPQSLIPQLVSSL